jgi:hypothetical protein|tara:strand:- start:2544 stop:3278 length:735 start_codon:yes stop_codon:yes gene_type:complete
MDIRQLVIVAHKRDEVVEKLCNLFEINVAYYDPGIIHFGLENALLPIGNTFLEVISPVQENTTAGRFLDRRGGDGGYMVIIQVDDFASSKKAVEKASIDIVFESEDPSARAIHLHPKQLGGAILSLDSMDPPESWKWAGDNWIEKVDTTLVDSIAGVQVQSSDPLEMKNRWLSVLPSTAKEGESIINLDHTDIEFTEDLDKRGNGVSAFKIKVKDKEEIYKRAKVLNLLINHEIEIGGVKFLLS